MNESLGMDLAKDLIDAGLRSEDEANAASRVVVELGDKVKDKLTYYEGIVVGFATYMYDVDQVLVQSIMLNNGSPTSHWFPLQQVELVITAAEEVKHHGI